LTWVERLPPAVEHLQTLSKNFVQSGDQTIWRRIADGLEALKANLRPTSDVAVQWQAEMGALGTNLESYARILNQIRNPAILLNREKDRLKSISLSFSQEVEKQIVRPYQQQEGERIYKGSSSTLLRSE